MKYIKKYESKKKIMEFTVNIENLTEDEIRLVVKKIVKLLPVYKNRMSKDLYFLYDTDPKYLKCDYKNYKYIIVSMTYTYLDNRNAIHDSKELDIIDGTLFLTTNSVPELIENLKASKEINKFNL